MNKQVMLFSTDCRTTPHQNQLTLVHLSVCDSTAVSSHHRLVAVRGLVVVHRHGALGAAWSTWSTNESHRKRIIRGEADSGDAPGPWTHTATASLLRENKNYSSPRKLGPTTYIFARKEVPPYACS